MEEPGRVAQELSRPPVRVVYVLGVYRSGTTVLSNLLGQLDGWLCVGELRAIWREMQAPDALCGCGLPFAACQLWSRTLAEAFGEAASSLAAETLRWQQEALLERHTWRRVHSLLKRPRLEMDDSDALTRYAVRLLRLYRAIADTTGANVVVDSSKEPTDAALLRLLPGVDPVFVHIVRDPRGTIYSRHRLESGVDGASNNHWAQTGYTALSWAAGNRAASAVLRAEGPPNSIAMRYEDFVARPQEAVDAIGRLAGISADGIVSADKVAEIGVTHTVAGNDNRFRTGPVALRPDEAWKQALHPLDRTIATIITAPLLARYRYPPFDRLVRSAKRGQTAPSR